MKAPTPKNTLPTCRLRHANILLTALLIGFACQCTAMAQGASEFISIFDGQTLNGWSPSHPEAARDWFVQDGYLIGKTNSRGSYLIYDGNRDIADFELKLTYRFPGKGNSGINIRAKKDSTGKRSFQAYHVDLGHLGIGKNVLGVHLDRHKALLDLTPRPKELFGHSLCRKGAANAGEIGANHAALPFDLVTGIAR